MSNQLIIKSIDLMSLSISSWLKFLKENLNHKRLQGLEIVLPE